MNQFPLTDGTLSVSRYSHPLLHNISALSSTNTNVTSNTVSTPVKSSAYNSSQHSTTQQSRPTINHYTTTTPLLTTNHTLTRPQYLPNNETLHISNLYQSPVRSSTTGSVSHPTDYNTNNRRRDSSTNALNNSTVHSPVQHNLSVLVRDKERELQQLHQYKQTIQQQNVSHTSQQHTDHINATTLSHNNTVLNHTQEQLNNSIRVASDSLHITVSELRHELKQKNLHINELERRIEQLHQLIASKDTDAIQYVEEKQALLNRYEKRVDKLNRAHAIELQSLRHEFELAQQSMYDELAERQSAENQKTLELQQMLQSSEMAFAERKRTFAEKESTLQHQIATYATHALNYEREINILKQQGTSLNNENHELKLVARSYEDTLNNTQAQLQIEQNNSNQTIQQLQSQIDTLKSEHQSVIDNYERRTVELVAQLHAVENEIQQLNDKHTAQLNDTVQSIQQQHTNNLQQLTAQHSADISTLHTQLQQTEQQINKIQLEKQQLSAQLQTNNELHQQYVAEHQHTIQSYEHRITELEQKYRDSSDKIESLNKKLSERETELGQHFVELQQSKSREKDLNKKLSDHRDTTRQQSDQLTSTYQGKLHDMNERMKRVERELNDKSLALQAEQSRTSELTALVSTLRSVTSETARIKTIEQQQLLNEYNGNLNTVKNEINKLAISPRTATTSHNNVSTVQTAGTKTVKLRTIGLNELENMQQNNSHSIPPTPKLGNLVSVPMTSRQ